MIGVTWRRGLLPIALLSLVAASGCLFRGTLPARELYRLTVPDTLPLGSAHSDSAPVGGGGGSIVRPVLDGTLGIMSYEAPGLYGEPSIVYRVGETAYGVYPSREWALPLGDMLGQMTARLSAGRGLTRDLPLFDPPSPRGQTYLWRARVREFEEVNRGNTLLVAVRIDATIVRTRDDSVVWSGSAGRERPVVGGTDMPTVVRTLSEAAAGVIGQLLERAEHDLSRPGVNLRAAADTARRAP